MNSNAIKLAAVVVLTAGLTIVTPMATTSAEVSPAVDAASTSTAATTPVHIFNRPKPCYAWRCAV
ncbi:MAG: hypothetical protein QOH68_28 [Nocardioidaceae bacterium]|jgi:hypothetical protein|nr:hypothetical protein [Nocardioidaceae bacterium]